MPVEYAFVPMVGILALFSFLGVVSWCDARRRERDAFYRNEIAKKMADIGEESRRSVLQFLDEQERIRVYRRRERLRLGGVITAVTAVAIMILLRGLAQDAKLGVPPQVYLTGLIPFCIGVVLVFFSLQSAAFKQQRDSDVGR